MKRTDYAPVIAQRNPHAEQARAAMREYYAEMRGETLTQEPPPVLAVAVEVAPEHPPAPAAVAAPDAALLDAVWHRWPDMRQYADTARLETVYDAQHGGWREAVTVTVWERTEQ